MKTYVLTEDGDCPIVLIVKARNKKHAIELVRKKNFEIEESLIDAMKLYLREFRDGEVYFTQGGA
jgi:hypothetical protein